MSDVIKQGNMELKPMFQDTHNPYVLLQFKHPIWSTLEVGKVAVNENDEFMYFIISNYGEYNEAEVAVFRSFVQEDSVVVEAGSNIGMHTLALAEIARRGYVYALEPQMLAFQCLCANLVLNGIVSVDTIRAAVGAENKTIHVPRANPYVSFNTGGLVLDETLSVGDETRMLPLDSGGLDRLDFLKADVEGMEADVLEGARETIMRCRPVIYLEFQWNRGAILRALRSMGYTLYRHDAPYWQPGNFLGCGPKTSPSEIPVDHIVAEMLLALPAEKDFTANLDNLTGLPYHGRLEQIKETP